LAWVLEGDGGFGNSTQHVYKLKEYTFLQCRMKFYITQKGELELLNQDQALFPASFIIFQMDISSYNRLESSFIIMS
jgi:hypothetical protein